MPKDSAAYGVAGAGISMPLWLSWLHPTIQILGAVLGLVLLALTIRNKWLDGRIKSATLRALAAEAAAEVALSTDSRDD